MLEFFKRKKKDIAKAKLLEIAQNAVSWCNEPLDVNHKYIRAQVISLLSDKQQGNFITLSYDSENVSAALDGYEDIWKVESVFGDKTKITRLETS